MEFLKLPERRFLPPQWSLVLSLLAVPFLLGAVSIILAFHLGVPILAISPPPSICSVPAEHAVPSPSGLPRHPLITIEPPLEPHPTSSAVNVSDVLLGPFITAAESMRPEEVLCNITKPCTDCFLTAIWAELRRGDDPDTVLYANVTLHHVILFNGGRPDPVCPRLFGERFFGAGAERWTRRFDGAHGASGAWGYAVRPDDQWDAVFELHNEAPDAVDAFIALRFEWVDAQSAVGRGVRELRVAWLDITGCGNSERPVPTTSEPFAYTTPKWTANVNGTILDVSRTTPPSLSVVVKESFGTKYAHGDPGCSAPA